MNHNGDQKNTQMETNRSSPDLILLIIVLCLVAIGLIMVFSSSATLAQSRYGESYYFLRRQAVWALLGFIGMYIASRIRYWKWKDLSVPLLALNFFLLAAVFIPGIGAEVHGAERWLYVNGITIQPAEFTKLALVICVSTYIARCINESQLKSIVISILIVGTSCFLILLQPDMGTTIAVVLTAFVIIFVAGVNLIYILGLGSASIPIVFSLVMGEQYRIQRLLSFLNPWEDPMGSGYQVIQSLYALGPGGLIGSGLGRSRQKLFYLPEPHNDFIFAVLGEELGFIGTFLVVALFLALIWRGYKIAVHAPDFFAALLAAGITAMIGLQAFINIGVVTASIPVTGINLPFISAGGSSLFFTLVGIGILLNISKHTRKNSREKINL